MWVRNCVQVNVSYTLAYFIKQENERIFHSRNAVSYRFKKKTVKIEELVVPKLINFMIVISR